MNRMHAITLSLFTAATLAAGAAFAAGHAAAPAAPAAAAAPMPPAVKLTGGILTDKNGMTLYTFDKDVAGNGKSACNGDCLAKWPALVAADSAKDTGEFTIVTRDDGRKQWAFKGKPLYLWVGDTKAGDTTGDGVGGVWHKVTK